MSSSLFIKAMHPKSEVSPDPSSIQRILSRGWVGQLKIHGHRAQIHIPSAESDALIAYTRQGRKHSIAVPEPMSAELFRLFRPTKGWNVIDAEWLKEEERLFVFDFLKQEGKILSGLTYPQRWQMLPRAFISPHVQVLPILSDLQTCLAAIQTPGCVEGLVFKSTTSTGFSDTSIVRCRRKL